MYCIKTLHGYQVKASLTGGQQSAISNLLFKIAHLEVNPHPISMLDDLLLFICIPSFFLYTFFKIAPEASGYMTARPETLFSTILVVRREKFTKILL